MDGQEQSFQKQGGPGMGTEDGGEVMSQAGVFILQSPWLLEALEESVPLG